MLDHKKKEAIHDQLKRLFDHSITNNPFNDKDTHHLIGLISECRILDPACGSGAFPMGILNRMVNLLSRLDPNNRNLYRLTAAEYDLILSDLKLSDTFRESCRAAFHVEK